jgi:hypothetical protein
MHGMRRHQRVKFTDHVQLAWMDESGAPRFVRGRTTDVSASGMRVECLDPIPVRCHVSFKLANHALHGSGSVRSCQRVGLKYAIGVEFSGGLTYPVEQLQH